MRWSNALPRAPTSCRPRPARSRRSTCSPALRSVPPNADTRVRHSWREHRRRRGRPPPGDGSGPARELRAQRPSSPRGRASLHFTDGAEYGRQIHLPATGRLVDDHGANRLVRPRKIDEARRRRPDLHANRCRRRSGIGPIDVLHGDGRGGEHLATQHARSLLLIDEVGRGTGTLDGLAIAQAICEFLVGLEEQSPLVLFATHFHELCALAEHWDVVANYHITAVENTARGGAPVFSHRVQPGSSSRSFGIEVARMAGLPDAVIERAQEIADALSGEADIETRVPLRKKMPKRPEPERQLSLVPCHPERSRRRLRARREGRAEAHRKALSLNPRRNASRSVPQSPSLPRRCGSIVEFASNAGWFGPGTSPIEVILTFSRRSPLASRPPALSDRQSDAMLAGTALPRRVVSLLPAIFTLQIIALYVMETTEQLSVDGHVLGPMVWLGVQSLQSRDPCGLLPRGHALDRAIARGLAVTTLRVIALLKTIASFATRTGRDSAAAPFRRSLLPATTPHALPNRRTRAPSPTNIALAFSSPV